MTNNIDRHLINLKSKGYTYIYNAITKKKCSSIIVKSKKILNKLIKNKSPYTNRDYQQIINPFRHDLSLLTLIQNNLVEQVLNKVIDKDHVLIQTSFINRRLRPDLPRKLDGKKVGENFHFDSRILGNKRLSGGFGFLVILMLNDFNKNNGATLFVPNSHKIRDLPDLKKHYKHKCLTGKAGTIVIMDTGLWHKTGDTSLNDRWGMFNVYGGWFVKPYYRYWEMKELKNKKLSKKFRKLLHLYSVPPINELKTDATLIKFR